MKIFKTSVAYSIVGVLPQLFSFLILPFLTTALTVEEYGRVSLFEALLFLFSSVVCLSLDRVVIRELADADTELAKKDVFNTILSISFISSAVFFTCLYALFYFVFPQYLFHFTLFFAIASLRSLLLIFSRKAQAEYKLGYFALSQLPRTFLDVSLIAILVIVFDMGFSGYLIALALSAILSTIITSKLIFNGYQPIVSRPAAKKALHLAIPLIPSVIFLWLLNLSARFLVDHFHGSEEVGYYGMIFKVASILGLLYYSIQLAYAPIFFKKLENLQFEELNSITNELFKTIFVLAVGLSVFSAEVFLLLDEAYFEYHIYVCFIAAAFYLSGLSGMTSNLYIQQSRKSALSLKIIVIFSVQAVTINYFVVQAFSFQGAMLTAIVTNLVLLTVQFLIFRRYVSNLLSPKIFRFAILAFPMLVIDYYVDKLTEPSMQLFFFKLLVMLFFATAMFYKSGIRIYEKRKF